MIVSLVTAVLVSSGMFATPRAPVVPAPGPVETFAVRSVRIVGNSRVPTDRLLRAFGQPGDLTYLELTERIAALNGEYARSGYAFCGVVENSQLTYDPASRTLTLKVTEPLLGSIRCAGFEELARRVALEVGDVVRIDSVKRFVQQTAVSGRRVMAFRPRYNLEHSFVDLELEVR